MLNSFLEESTTYLVTGYTDLLRGIVHTAVEKLHITGTIACHSLRKTFGYHAAVEESMSPVLLMEIYNHSSFEVTKRYLGLRQEELDTAYLSVTLF